MLHVVLTLVPRVLLAALAAIVATTPAAAQGRVGVTAAVNQQAELERRAAVRTLVIGEDVEFEDRIITSSTALVQVLFVDGSTFTVGSNSRVVVDEFVFNPATGSGELVAEVTRGALRFVGGRLSKQDNNVRFRTPVGTLGVRGAIVEIDLSPSCMPDGRCPIAVATLVFGDELTLEQADGGRRRIYERGYAFVIFDTPGGRQTQILPLSLLEQGDLQRRLSGRPGQSGGSSNIPTGEDVVRSGLPAVNSGRAPFVVVPRPKPQIVSTDTAPDEDAPGIGDTEREVRRTITEPADSDAVRDGVAGEVPGVIRTTLSRTFVSPETYETETGVIIPNPSAQHILRAVPADVIAVELVEEAPGRPVAVRIGDLELPFPAEEGETPIEPVFSDEFDGRVTGTILRGPGGFALYYLQEDVPDGAEGTVLYLAVGNPTPASVFYPGANARPAEVRTYDLGADYQRVNRGIAPDVPLLNPLVAQAFGNDFLTAATETPYYVIERVDVTSNARGLHAALHIEGLGADQRSMIVSDAGDLFDQVAGSGDPALGFGGSRRGSYRVAAGAESIFMRGGTGSMRFGEGDLRTSIAGPNGEAFIYSSGLDQGLARNQGEQEFLDVELEDPLRGPLTPEQYSSMTVPAFLADSEPLSALSRQERTLNGFAAGLVESADGSVTPFRSNDAGDYTVQFDPANGTLGGIVFVEDVTGASSVDAYQYAFGFDVTGTVPFASGGRSAYLDDDNFAASSTGPSNSQGSSTTLLFTEENVYSHNEADPGTYIVSADMLPQQQLFSASGVAPCECRFMEWGWWGTQTEFEDPSAPGGRRHDFVHLGTWAAGDIPTNDELPVVGTGSFEGHAVGNVAAATEGGVAQYVAVGDMSLTYDFGAREGTLAINNFDSRSFSGTVTGGSTPGVLNQFGGPLSGSGLAGAATGSFTRGPEGPAQGVLGAFDVGAPGYSATGTFIGERGAVAP